MRKPYVFKIAHQARCREASATPENMFVSKDQTTPGPKSMRLFCLSGLALP
jgi:hypothetical protein